MSEQGKPVRRRGRPPKLPVLSQLLTEQKAPHGDQHRTHSQLQEAARMETDSETPAFSLVPLVSQRGNLEGSALDAFSASSSSNNIVVDSSGVVAFPTSVKQEAVEARDRSVLFPTLPAVRGCSDAMASHSNEQVHHVQQVKREAVEDATRAGKVGAKDVSGRGGETERDRDGDRFQDASLETRFNMLANQLGLEIGSAYHASLVYNQSLSSSSSSSSVPASSSSNSSANAALYQQMMLSSRSLVEMKPRRRQLNNLIKPSDDCVYTSFRIRPRNSGRRGGKRGGRRKGGAGSRYNPGKSMSLDLPSADDYPPKDAFFRHKEGAGAGGGGGDGGGQAEGVVGSAVITERIPGAGEVPQRLYRDLYHCKLCNELLPADSSLPHTCSMPVSPPLRSCDVCGTMYLSGSSPAPPEGSGQASVCEDCAHKGQALSSPALSPCQDLETSRNGGGSSGTPEGFACQPCGVQFMSIADYIQHRRSSHLEKLNRQSRKTHTLKTLPCPARGCPRLFHMHAELSRHLSAEHPEESSDQGGVLTVVGIGEGEAGRDGVVAAVSPTSTSCGVDQGQDVDVETVPDHLPEAEVSMSVEEEQPQFSCSQSDCGKRFYTPLDLLEHVLGSHEDVSHWPCPLPGCARQFGAERHLRVHLLMHKEEKPLKCPFCHYRCRQKNALHWHIRKHPEAAGQYRRFAGVSPDS